MPRRPFSRWIHSLRSRPRPVRGPQRSEPTADARHTMLALRWVAEETGLLAAALRDDATRRAAARAVLGCSERAAVAARQVDRARRCLEEVHGDGSIP